MPVKFIWLGTEDVAPNSRHDLEGHRTLDGDISNYKSCAVPLGARPQLAVTLQSEGEDARWTLLEAKVDVKAREGESITAPATNFRQQRYVGSISQPLPHCMVDRDGAMLSTDEGAIV